jgi:hypothetical protein
MKGNSRSTEVRLPLAYRCGTEIHLEVCQTNKGEFLLLWGSES